MTIGSPRPGVALAVTETRCARSVPLTLDRLSGPVDARPIADPRNLDGISGVVVDVVQNPVGAPGAAGVPPCGRGEDDRMAQPVRCGSQNNTAGVVTLVALTVLAIWPRQVDALAD